MRLKNTLKSLLLFAAFLLVTSLTFAQADLSLSLTQSNANPPQYGLYSIELTVRNDGPVRAGGVTVDLPKPAGVVYQGGNEYSTSGVASTLITYGINEGHLTVGALFPGDSSVVTINYFLNATSASAQYAQILTSLETDPDSTPGNGTHPTVNEDDEASTAINGGFVPDLTLSNLVLSQNPVDSGAQIDFTFDINNIGAGSIAQNFLIQAYISTDQTISTDDLQNGTVPTGNFGAGQTVAGVVGASVPVGLSPGNYFLILHADGNGQVQESNETNNTIVLPLTIQAVVNSTCEIAVNNVASVTCNDNGTPNDPSDDSAGVQFQVTNGSAGGFFDVEDAIGNNIGSGVYGRFAGFNIPNIANYSGMGKFVLRDRNDPTCSTTFNISVPAPCSNGTGTIDLAVGITQNQSQPAQYSLYSVTARVVNSGSALGPATGVVVDLPLPAGVVYQGGNEYTATQGQLSTYGPTQGEWNVGTIPVGQNAEITINYFLRVTSSPDSYVEVIAANEQDIDSTPGNGNGQVNEDDEATTLINGGFVPDLTLSNLALVQNTVDSGEQVDFTVDINNLGLGSIAQNFLVQAYISTDNVLSSDDLQNGTIPTGNFAGGQTVAGVAGSSIPTGLAPGNYFLILEADANDQVLESDENNNTISIALTIDPVVATCNITATVQRIDCDDQGTPIETDDTYSMTFLVENGGATGTWTASNGGVNPSFSGSYGVPYTLQGGNIWNTINLGGLVLSVGLTDDLDPSCSTSITWQTPGSTCSSSSDPCDAITEYQNSLAAPEKVTWSTDTAGVIKVVYLTPGGVADSFSVNGPSALGVTPVANSTLFARDVVCTSLGFAIAGTYRDIVNPGSNRAWVIQLTNVGVVRHADVADFTGGFLDLFSFGFVDVATTGANGDVLYTEAYSGGRSYQIAAFDDENNLLWQDQRIGDLVTNRIGGAVLSEDEVSLYFSYRDGNSPSWPRLRGVDASDGTTRWEARLGDLIVSTAFSVTGDVSIPIALSNGNGVLGFTAYDGTELLSYAANFDDAGLAVSITQLPTRSGFSQSLYVPVYLGANDEVVFLNGGSEFVVTESGMLANCGGATGVDLELEAVSAQAQPGIYDTNSITFTLTNAGTEMATGVTIDAPLPANVVYTGGNEYTASQGTLSTFGNNIWTVGDLAPGATATLVVNYFSLSSTGYAQFGEVLTLNEVDVDSSPGNGSGTSASEDDEVYLDLSTTAPLALTFFPNPAPQGEQIILDFVSSGETTQAVIFSDLTGRPVRTVSVNFQEGRNRIPVDLGLLPGGVYFVAFPESGLLPQRIMIQE